MAHATHIHSPEKFDQFLDFSDLRFGKIRPTDSDGGILELFDKMIVRFEVKRGGVMLPLGQVIALERTHRNHLIAGKHALTIIAPHGVPVGESVPVGKLRVREYLGNHLMFDRQGYAIWKIPDEPISVRGLVLQFAKQAGIYLTE